MTRKGWSSPCRYRRKSSILCLEGCKNISKFSLLQMHVCQMTLGGWIFRCHKCLLWRGSCESGSSWGCNFWLVLWAVQKMFTAKVCSEVVLQHWPQSLIFGILWEVLYKAPRPCHFSSHPKNPPLNSKNARKQTLKIKEPCLRITNKIRWVNSLRW